MKDLVIGIDSSTTACKAIAWDVNGQPVASGRAELSLSAPRPGWAEQDALDWWRACASALRQVTAALDPSRLAALCITHQRETFVPLDAAAAPLRPGIVWMDDRSRPLLPQMERALGRQRFQRVTGKPLAGNLTIGKIAWIRENEPDIFARTAYYADVAAFLVLNLTGCFHTGWGCADPTGLFDMQKNTWANAFLDYVGIKSAQLPRAFPPAAVIGEITPRAAAETGLPAGLPVAAGIGDGQSGGLGTNITTPGSAYLSLGTSTISGAYSAEYVTNPAFRTLYGGIPGTYLAETAILSGGYTVSWFIDTFMGDTPENRRERYRRYESEASVLPPGAEGLTVLPHWNSSINDSSSSGGVIGFRGIHRPAHLYRAILEGVAFEQRQFTEGVERSFGMRVEKYVAMSGGARSPLWLQIIADVTGKCLQRSAEPEAAALGAGIHAAAAAGLFPDVRQAAQSMTRLLPGVVEPDPANQARYDAIYRDVYTRLYHSLRPVLHALAEINLP